jgi:hypothetical protein
MELVLNKKYVLSLLIISATLGSGSLHSAVSANNDSKKIKYRTNFGHCPSRIAGQMAMRLIKNFEKSGSLRSVKDEIVNEGLEANYFVSDYKIKFDPLKKSLNFTFKCPRPLMKVQVYKDNGLDSYEAILVENGELYDPTYEVLLRSDRKLTSDLPFLALPVGAVSKNVEPAITTMIVGMGDAFRKKVSEVIIDDGGEMTVILSLQGHPSSVFMGNGDWDDKMLKLKRIVRTMEKKRKIPAIINLTNAKKVVVKFNTKI